MNICWYFSRKNPRKKFTIQLTWRAQFSYIAYIQFDRKHFGFVLLFNFDLNIHFIGKQIIKYSPVNRANVCCDVICLLKWLISNKAIMPAMELPAALQNIFPVPCTKIGV